MILHGHSGTFRTTTFPEEIVLMSPRGWVLDVRVAQPGAYRWCAIGRELHLAEAGALRHAADLAEEDAQENGR